MKPNDPEPLPPSPKDNSGLIFLVALAIVLLFAILGYCEKARF